MNFALVTTQHFERRARKFLRKHPDLRSTLRDTLDDLSRDPFEPQLKLHPLSGNLAGVQAVSLTYSYRLTLLVRVTEQEIVLLDIGTHDVIIRRDGDSLVLTPKPRTWDDYFAQGSRLDPDFPDPRETHSSEDREPL